MDCIPFSERYEPRNSGCEGGWMASGVGGLVGLGASVVGLGRRIGDCWSDRAEEEGILRVEPSEAVFLTEDKRPFWEKQ